MLFAVSSLVLLAAACSAADTADSPTPSGSTPTPTVPAPTATVPAKPADAGASDGAAIDAAISPKISLSGRYEAPCRFALEVQGAKLYETNVLVGTDTGYSLDVNLFLDPTCTAKFVTLAEKATYVARPTSRADGAAELDVTRTAMTMTAHHPASLPMLDNGKCGDPPWSVGQAQDVFAGGCGVAGFAPAAVCHKDFDLLKTSGTGFSFGKRPMDNDLCTPEKRPSELSTVVFVRQP